MRSLLLILAILNIHASASASTIPTATGTALDGHTVTLPRDLPARATILILGFSRNSASTTTAWEKPIRTGLSNLPSVGTPAAIGYLDMPFLEDAPSFIRPLILHDIRKQVPAVLKPNFIPITTGEAAWKQIAGYSNAAPNAAYILLVDRSGNVHWKTHEAFTPAHLNELSNAARQLAAETK